MSSGLSRDRVRDRPEAWAAGALVLIYLAVMSGHSYSIDGVLIYRQAVSLVHDLSFRFAQPIYWGDVYPTSKYGIGLSLLYIPGVLLLAFVMKGGIPTPATSGLDWNLFYHDFVYAIGAAPVHILITAATAYLVARLIRELGFGSNTALLGLAAFGIASPAIVYARGDFAQPLLALCLTGGMLACVRWRANRSKSMLLAACLALCLAVLSRPVEGSFLLPAFAALALPDLRPATWIHSRWGAVAALAGAYAVAVAATLLVNWARYGSPLSTGYSEISWGTPPWVGIPGVLISPARGVLWEFPLIALSPIGLGVLWSGPHRVFAGASAVLILFLFLNAALWIPWWGAQSWGSRLFVPATPLLALLAAIGASAIRANVRRWLVPTLFLWGVIWALPGTITDLLGGYAATYDGSAQSFRLAGYPPIGAWLFLRHLRASSLTDSSGIDILWFRVAVYTHNLSLLVPAILVVAALALAWAAWRRLRPVPEALGVPA